MTSCSRFTLSFASRMSSRRTTSFAQSTMLSMASGGAGPPVISVTWRMMNSSARAWTRSIMASGTFGMGVGSTPKGTVPPSMKAVRCMPAAATHLLSRMGT